MVTAAEIMPGNLCGCNVLATVDLHAGQSSCLIGRCKVHGEDARGNPLIIVHNSQLSIRRSIN